MKRIFILIIIASFSLVLASCGKEVNEVVVDRAHQFIVGLECNYAPFNWTEDRATPYNYPIENFSGKYADGYDVQIAKAVASSLGKVLVVKKLEWDALIPSLETNKIDAIIAGMSPTEDRKSSVLFSDAYYRSSHVILLKKDSSFINAKTLNDFNGARIVGQQGTIYDDLIPQLIGTSHQTPLKNIPDILANISANKSDGTILEKPVATGVILSHPEFTFIELESGFQVSDEDVVVSVALRLDEEVLASKINNILSAITEETRLFLMEQAVNRSNE